MQTRKKKGSIHGVIGPPKAVQSPSDSGKLVPAVIAENVAQPAPHMIPPVATTSQAPPTIVQQQQQIPYNHGVAVATPMNNHHHHGRSNSVNNNSNVIIQNNDELPSFTAQPSKHSVDENILESLGLEIQRAMSAPPAMEFAQENIFSYQSKYGHLFGWDIRADEEYESFYNSHNNAEKPLPAPFESNFWVATPQWGAGAGGWNGNEAGKFGFYDEMQNLSLNDYPKQEVSMQHLEKAALELTEPDPNAANWEMPSKQPHYQANHLAQPVAQKPASGKARSMSYSSVAAATNAPLLNNNATPLQPPVRMVTPPAMNLSDPSEQDLGEDLMPHHARTNSKSPSPPNVPNKSKDSKSAAAAAAAAAAASNGNNTPSKYNTVAEVTGKIYQLSKDQHGCRFLQKKLEEGEMEDLEAIYSEVYPHIVELMTDPFGNYLCQKLVEFCNEKQKTAVISAVAPALVKISMNMHGTRAVQKLIECLASPVQINKVIDALRHHVVPLIKDLNGNHVIQRCLQKMTYQDKQFIYDAVAPRCVDVATHKHGCCVLQRCIDHASEDQKWMLVKEVINHALELVQNAFGNYVVQYILDLGNDEANSQIIAKFIGHITGLSQNKFSSNVIEKCLRISNSRSRAALLQDICCADLISVLIQDNYGNYVLQTALGVSDPKQFQDLSDAIRPLLHLVKNTPYGKKIESKLNKKPTGASNNNYRNNSQQALPQQQSMNRNNVPFGSPKKK